MKQLLQKLTSLISAFACCIYFVSCIEKTSDAADEQNNEPTIFGEYVSFSDFMPSELVVVIKPDGKAAFGMKSQPNEATYTIEGNKLTLQIIDGSKQVFLIDPTKPGVIIHEFTEATFTKNPTRK